MTNDSAVPRFFLQFPMLPVRDAILDETLQASDARLDILFLWGRDCPNCDVTKLAILAAPTRFSWTDVHWLQCNVYADPTMATRFGLHGIPTFLVFHRGRKLGRISPFPGTEAFVEAIDRQLARDDLD